MSMKEKRRKIRKLIVTLLLVFCSVFVIANCKTTAVQAASASTMKKEYTKFVKKNKSNIKGYNIVNIGPSEKPVLLTVTRSDWKQGNTYYSCKVYYYIRGKVRFMNSYGGGRPLALYKRNGNYYLWNGNSSDKTFACVRNDCFYVIVNRNSKEKYYKTSINYERTGRTTYKTYTVSRENYVNMNKKYKYYKAVKFQKVY